MGMEMLLNAIFKMAGINPATVFEQVKTFIEQWEAFDARNTEMAERLKRIERLLDPDSQSE